MKKYTQIIAVLVVFTLLVIAKQSLAGGDQDNLGVGDDHRRQVVAPSGLDAFASLPPMANPTVSTAPTPKATTTPATPTPAQATTTPTATPTPTPQGKYKNGTYTGTVADAYYGYVQVQAIVTGGKITDVKFLQYPNDNGTSISINSQAMPYLTQEALQAQSSNVNTVSGASATSGAFRQSLQAALAQAV